MNRRLLACLAILLTFSSSGAFAVPLLNGMGGTRGYGESFLAPNDDGSTGQLLTSAFGNSGLNFFGVNYTSFWLNNNGNISFTGPLSSYTPTGITAGSTPMVAIWWADVDTRGGATPQGDNLLYYDFDAATKTFTATWDYVGYYSYGMDKTNAFQMRLKDRADTGAGNFDIEFRYAQLQWTTGGASGGSGGLGGTPARAGYTNGAGEYFEFPQSGNQEQMLGLVSPGYFLFEVRSGEVTVAPTVPEPGTIALLGSGLLGLVGVARRRRRK